MYIRSTERFYCFIYRNSRLELSAAEGHPYRREPNQEQIQNKMLLTVHKIPSTFTSRADTEQNAAASQCVLVGDSLSTVITLVLLVP